MRICVASLKGGSGKTCTTVMLAEAAALAGQRAMVIDLDPQTTGSATAWAELAASDQPLRSTVISLPPKELGRLLRNLSSDYGFVAIDTPPGSESVVSAAIRNADLALLALNARLADLERSHAVIDLAGEYGTPIQSVLSRTRPKVKITAEIAEALDGLGAPVAGEIRESERTADAYGRQPTAAALKPFTQLLTALENSHVQS